MNRREFLTKTIGVSVAAAIVPFVPLVVKKKAVPVIAQGGASPIFPAYWCISDIERVKKVLRDTTTKNDPEAIKALIEGIEKS